jgi:hypothetical protein
LYFVHLLSECINGGFRLDVVSTRLWRFLEILKGNVTDFEAWRC